MHVSDNFRDAISKLNCTHETRIQIKAPTVTHRGINNLPNSF